MHRFWRNLILHIISILNFYFYFFFVCETIYVIRILDFSVVSASYSMLRNTVIAKSVFSSIFLQEILKKSHQDFFTKHYLVFIVNGLRRSPLLCGVLLLVCRGRGVLFGGRCLLPPLLFWGQGRCFKVFSSCADFSDSVAENRNKLFMFLSRMWASEAVLKSAKILYSLSKADNDLSDFNVLH